MKSPMLPKARSRRAGVAWRVLAALWLALVQPFGAAGLASMIDARGTCDCDHRAGAACHLPEDGAAAHEVPACHGAARAVEGSHTVAGCHDLDGTIPGDSPLPESSGCVTGLVAANCCGGSHGHVSFASAPYVYPTDAPSLQASASISVVTVACDRPVQNLLDVPSPPPWRGTPNPHS